MAKIVKLSYSNEFRAQCEAARNMGEDNDCSVKALSLLTKVSYAECHAALAQAGRKPGRGVSMAQIVAAAEALGFAMTRQPFRLHNEIIACYPERDRVLMNITTHHPRRFAKVWSTMPNMMFETDRHVAAFVDGKVVDWSVNKALRVRALWVLTKLA